MVEMRRVTVTAERGTTSWVLECIEAGAVSQCKRLTQADAEMREAIAYQLDIPTDSFEIDLNVIAPAEYRELAARATQLRHQAQRLPPLKPQPHNAPPPKFSPRNTYPYATSAPSWACPTSAPTS